MLATYQALDGEERCVVQGRRAAQTYARQQVVLLRLHRIWCRIRIDERGEREDHVYEAKCMAGGYITCNGSIAVVRCQRHIEGGRSW